MIENVGFVEMDMVVDKFGEGEGLCFVMCFYCFIVDVLCYFVDVFVGDGDVEEWFIIFCLDIVDDEIEMFVIVCVYRLIVFLLLCGLCVFFIVWFVLMWMMFVCLFSGLNVGMVEIL